MMQGEFQCYLSTRGFACAADPICHVRVLAIVQVHIMRTWLLQRLAYVYSPGGRHGVGARAICRQANSPYMMVTFALREEFCNAECGRVLQAAVRRCLQVASILKSVATCMQQQKELAMPGNADSDNGDDDSEACWCARSIMQPSPGGTILDAKRRQTCPTRPTGPGRAPRRTWRGPAARAPASWATTATPIANVSFLWCPASCQPAPAPGMHAHALGDLD